VSEPDTIRSKRCIAVGVDPRSVDLRSYEMHEGGGFDVDGGERVPTRVAPSISYGLTSEDDRRVACGLVLSLVAEYAGILSTTLPKTPINVWAVADREHEIMGLEGVVGASPFA